MAVTQDTSTQTPIIVPTGLTEPSVYYSIIGPNGSQQNMSGASVMFLMRPLLSRVPVVSESATTIVPADTNGNNVVYNWSAGDTAIEGPYMGWFAYELPATAMAETPEFRIMITDHGPGFGTPTGAIVDGINQWLPTTLRALRNDPSFGDRMLQRHAEYIQMIVMGTVVAPDLEVVYNPALVDYLSKRTAVRIIPAAKDYWSRQPTAVSAQGPSENASYPNMLASLDALCMRLNHECAQDWRQLQRIVPGLPQLHVEPRPMSSLGDPSLLNQRPTPDPALTRPPELGGPWWTDWFLGPGF